MIHQPMPIIIGAPRSGTTLLRFMLDSHPELAIPPETGFLAVCPQLAGKKHVFRKGFFHAIATDLLSGWFASTTSGRLRKRFFHAVTNYGADAPGWADFHISREAFWAELVEIDPFTICEGCRAFYRLYASRFGKTRWGDKTPLYCMHMEAIESILPEAYFVHIIRDGRDVALSLRQMWFSPGWEMETQADHWRKFVSSARRQAGHCKHYLELRYEELVANPRDVLERICGFLDLTLDDAMLRYYERTPHRIQEHKGRFRLDGSLVVSQEQRYRQQWKTTEPPDPRRVFAWRSSMSIDERARFESRAGDLLRELGYETEGW